MSEEAPNINYLWCSVIAKTLENCGLENVVICPGSRSTPLVYAFARETSVKAFSILDERSAGFFALGLARQSGRPVALVCTSGSAVANFFPAVIEASESGTPLLLLTADRPPELRNCAAGQTIDQVKIFGDHVRHYFEFPAPANDRMLLRSTRQQSAFAYRRSMEFDGGPVHLNLPFRDPLPPVQEGGFVPCVGAADLSAFTHVLDVNVSSKERLLNIPMDTQNTTGIVVVGPNNVPAEQRETWLENVADFCNALNWPVFADALSPVRFQSGAFRSVVTSYDLICRSSVCPPAPEYVIVIGDFPTSKVMRQWVSDAEPNIVTISNRLRHADATASFSNDLVHDFLSGPLMVRACEHTLEYTNKWLEADAAFRGKIDAAESAISHMSEAKVACVVASALPCNSTLCVSNSMAPRDFEFFAQARENDVHVYSSRGANGIDGILSTALGVAQKSERTFLYTGDLALLHDSNGGLIAKSLRPNLTVIVVNNDGGGIFEMLPVSACGEEFETFFGTPQSIDLEKWADLYGFDYAAPSEWGDLQELLSSESKGLRLIEVKTNRRNAAAERADLIRKILG